jgi:septal ring factor EnvC (AmiA/AmiB activator)
MTTKLTQIQQELATARMHRARLRLLLPQIEARIQGLERALSEVEAATVALEDLSTARMTGLDAVENSLRHIPDRKITQGVGI